MQRTERFSRVRALLSVAARGTCGRKRRGSLICIGYFVRGHGWLVDLVDGGDGRSIGWGDARHKNIAQNLHVLLDERLWGGEDVREPAPDLGAVLLHGALELCLYVYYVFVEREG